MPPAANTDVLLHVRTVIGIVLGLCIAHLLLGIARIVQQPGRQNVYPVHIGWALSTLLLVAHFWWWEARISLISYWTFGRYLFLIFYASLYYFLALLLFPDKMEGYAGYREYFLAKRAWFFGILAVIFCADIFDTLWKGQDYFASLGAEYPIRAAVYVVLCVIAMVVRSERFHALFVIANLGYQISWILRTYNTLT